jgi:hypothetical protein
VAETTQTKWTPGPWHVEEESDEHEIHSLEVYAGPRLIASVRPVGEAATATALLIASAPEMAEALRQIVRINGSTGGAAALVREFKFLAEQALAKAEGK